MQGVTAKALRGKTGLQWEKVMNLVQPSVLHIYAMSLVCPQQLSVFHGWCFVSHTWDCSSAEGKVARNTVVLAWSTHRPQPPSSEARRWGTAQDARDREGSGRYLQLRKANVRGVIRKAGTRRWGHVTAGRAH